MGGGAGCSFCWPGCSGARDEDAPGSRFGFCSFDCSAGADDDGLGNDGGGGCTVEGASGISCAGELAGGWLWLVPECAWANGTASRQPAANITSFVLTGRLHCSTFIKDATPLVHTEKGYSALGMPIPPCLVHRMLQDSTKN